MGLPLAAGCCGAATSPAICHWVCSWQEQTPPLAPRVGASSCKLTWKCKQQNFLQGGKSPLKRIQMFYLPTFSSHSHSVKLKGEHGFEILNLSQEMVFIWQFSGHLPHISFSLCFLNKIPFLAAALPVSL